MAAFGSLETIRAQVAGSPALAAALDHVKRCLTPGTPDHQRLMALSPDESGREELAHGAFALEQCYLTKLSEKAKWESHKEYIDVQAVISGDEIMEVADIADLTFAEDLTPGKDVILYQPYADGTRLRARDGFVAVFFPVDGHRAALAVDEPAAVRKVVVKVPVGD
jgi:YhcH/YjgK/YiaL family protein